MTSPRQRLDPERVTPFADAVTLVSSRVRALPAERVPLGAAAGRVLAETIHAPHALPPFDNSMVDGWALRVADVREASAAHPAELRVAGTVAAGDAPSIAVERGTAVRIMTGAAVPATADGIAMLEWTSWDQEHVRVERSVEPGQFIRRAGEDLSAGDTVFERGTRLGSAHVGVLGSLGQASVPVHRSPTVGVLVTGDELLTVHDELAPGRIRSSNDFVLLAAVREAGGLAVDLGVARDDRSDLRARLEGGRACDVLVTSGGVSVGDHDEVQAVLLEMGLERVFWRIASSPGKPLLFGTLGRCLVFGLPGNPVSTAVAFENFVRPTIRRLEGDAHPERARVRARALAPIAGPGPRRHFARVRLSWTSDGWVAREVGPRGSGNLRSMAHANGLAILPEEIARVEANEFVDVVCLGMPDFEAREA